MTKLLTLIASLCVVTACVANASDAGTETTSAEVVQPAAEGDDCVFVTPISWSEGSSSCRSFGNSVTYMSDGDSALFFSFGSGTGAGTCTITCTDGVPVRSNCTCHPR